ncbi:hypothetical protein D3C87_850510 [compost metagenome]
MVWPSAIRWCKTSTSLCRAGSSRNSAIRSNGASARSNGRRLSCPACWIACMRSASPASATSRSSTSRGLASANANTSARGVPSASPTNAVRRISWRATSASSAARRAPISSSPSISSPSATWFAVLCGCNTCMNHRRSWAADNAFRAWAGASASLALKAGLRGERGASSSACTRAAQSTRRGDSNNVASGNARSQCASISAAARTAANEFPPATKKCISRLGGRFAGQSSASAHRPASASSTAPCGATASACGSPPKRNSPFSKTA